MSSVDVIDEMYVVADAPLKAHLLAVKLAMEAGRKLGTPHVPLA